MEKWEELNTVRYYAFLNDIINSRGQWGIKDKYYEGHHIIPKSFGGSGTTKSNDKNIIRLYPQEHFEAHKILAEDNPNNKKVVSAWCMMAFPKTKTHKRDYPITKDEYAELRKLFGNIRKNTIVSEETRKKLSNALMGKTHQPFSEEHKAKLSAANKHSHNISNEGMEVLKNNSKNYLASLSKEEYEDYCQKHSDAMKNKKWFTNGEKDIRAYECPEGFWAGRTNMNSHSTKGMHKYNNGVVEIYSYECPDGFIEGRLPSYDNKLKRDKNGRFIKKEG